MKRFKNGKIVSGAYGNGRIFTKEDISNWRAGFAVNSD